MQNKRGTKRDISAEYQDRQQKLAHVAAVLQAVIAYGADREAAADFAISAADVVTTASNRGLTRSGYHSEAAGLPAAPFQFMPQQAKITLEEENPLKRLAILAADMQAAKHGMAAENGVLSGKLATEDARVRYFRKMTEFEGEWKKQADACCRQKLMLLKLRAVRTIANLHTLDDFRQVASEANSKDMAEGFVLAESKSMAGRAIR